jgi:LysM repeat protein
VDAGVSGRRARPAPTRVLAGLLVPAGLAVASAVLTWAASAPIAAMRAPGPAPVDALLAVGAALLCAGILALSAVGAALSLAIALSGQVTGRMGRLALLLTPHVVQAAVGLAVGVTVISGPVVGASSAAVTTPLRTAASVATHDVPGGPHQPAELPPAWSPDRPAAGHPRPWASTAELVTSRAASPGPTGRANAVAAVVVHRGDTLWGIAARHLGPSATDAQIAAEWPRWHAVNRSTIGQDPDLILPGQLLHAPQRRSPTEATQTHAAPTDSEESP